MDCVDWSVIAGQNLTSSLIIILPSYFLSCPTYGGYFSPMRGSDSQTVTIISNSYQIIANYRENLQDCLGKLAQHRDHWLFIRSGEHQNIWLCQVLYHQYLLHRDYFLITPIHQLHHYWDWVCEHHSISNSQQKTYKDSVMLSKMYFNTNSLRACARSSCYNTARKSSRLAFVPGIAFSPNDYWQEERKMGIFFSKTNFEICI